MDYDVIIIGGGPAGLTAGIYASRARLKTLLIESYSVIGQAVTADSIENYPGFLEGIKGFELIEKFKKHTEKFGAEFSVGEVKGIKEHSDKGILAWQVETENKIYTTLSIILACGASPKRLDVQGEDRLRGKGVSYCATCDGSFFKNKDVVVVGGGDSAIEEALFLTRFVNKLTVIHRRDALRATKILQEKAFSNKKIYFIWGSVVTEILGSQKVTGVKVKDVNTGKENEVSCEGVFIFVGYIPNTNFLKGAVELDKDGYIVTDDNMKASKDGIFACGDCRTKLLRQIVTACGDGAVAAFSCNRYVEELKG